MKKRWRWLYGGRRNSRWVLIMENASSLIKAVKEDEKVPEPLSDQVMEALMQVLPEYAKYYVAILVDTGLRTGELERIRWRDVDTINNRLTIPLTKNKTFKVVPMTNRLAVLFDSLRPGRTWAQTQSGHSNQRLALRMSTAFTGWSEAPGTPAGKKAPRHRQRLIQNASETIRIRALLPRSVSTSRRRI